MMNFNFSSEIACFLFDDTFFPMNVKMQLKNVFKNVIKIAITLAEL